MEMHHGGNMSSLYAHWLKKLREQRKEIYCSWCKYHRHENLRTRDWRARASRMHKKPNFKAERKLREEIYDQENKQDCSFWIG